MFSHFDSSAYRWSTALPLFFLLAAFAFAAEDEAARDRNEAKRRKNSDLTAVEDEFVKAINTARKKKDLKPLKVNAALVAACRDFAGEMAKRGEAADAFDGKQPGDRIQGAGVKPNRWGISNGKGKTKSVVSGWVMDPIAAANILEPNVNELGIGVAVDAAGENYVAVLYVEVPK